MITVKTKEWEITKSFIFDVLNKDGRINFDWFDFEGFAKEGKPSVMVKVEEPLSLRLQSVMAVDAIKKNARGNLCSLLVAVFYKNKGVSIMEEMSGLHDSLSELPADVDVTWGVLEAEDLINDYGVIMFAFEK